MADYTPDAECVLTPAQVRTLRAEAEWADKAVQALRDAAEGYYSYSFGAPVCNRCGFRVIHRDWCPVPRWEAMIAEYDALKEEA